MCNELKHALQICWVNVALSYDWLNILLKLLQIVRVLVFLSLRWEGHGDSKSTNSDSVIEFSIAIFSYRSRLCSPCSSTYNKSLMQFFVGQCWARLYCNQEQEKLRRIFSFTYRCSGCILQSIWLQTTSNLCVLCVFAYYICKCEL